MAESLVFTGDMGLTEAYSSTGEVMGGKLLDMLGSADGLCINLELPFRDTGTRMAPYTHPSLYSSVDKAAELASLKPAVVNIGTNHCMDGGREGLELTIRTLEDMGAVCIGAGLSESEAREPRFLRIGGTTFGFLSYCKKGNFTASGKKPGAALLSMENLREDLPEARKNCHCLVVSLHMGMEFSKSVHPMYRELALAAVDLGASCVIGHHPHVIQGMETRRGAPIFYSLGNLVFDNSAGAVTYRGHWKDRHRGLVVKLQFSPDGVGWETVPVTYTSSPLRSDLASTEEAESILKELETLSRNISFGTSQAESEAEAAGAIARRELATVAVLTRIHGLRFLWYFLKDLKPRHFRMAFRALWKGIRRK